MNSLKSRSSSIGPTEVLGPERLDVGDPFGGRTATPVRDVRLGFAEPSPDHDLADRVPGVGVMSQTV